MRLWLVSVKKASFFPPLDVIAFVRLSSEGISLPRNGS